jgi:hypothetical protein
MAATVQNQGGGQDGNHRRCRRDEGRRELGSAGGADGRIGTKRKVTHI